MLRLACPGSNCDISSVLGLRPSSRNLNKDLHHNLSDLALFLLILEDQNTIPGTIFSIIIILLRYFTFESKLKEIYQLP